MLKREPVFLWDETEEIDVTVEDALDDFNHKFRDAAETQKPIFCPSCLETMNWFWEWAHCPNGCLFSDKPDQSLWNFHIQLEPLVTKEPFQEKVLGTRHSSSRNKTSNDGKVIFLGFEKEETELILSLNVQLRWKPKAYTHKGVRLWPTWKRDWETVYTKKMSKWKKIKKNIRIHLIPSDTWYNISGIYSGKVKDKYKYTKMWNWWHLWEEDSPTFDKNSIQDITSEAYEEYKRYMVE